jgi:ubiquitin-protein ligase
MGIAYDWIRQERVVATVVTVTRKQQQRKRAGGGELLDSTQNQSRDEKNSTAASAPPNTSSPRHLLLGPIGTNLRVWHFSVRGPTGTNSVYAKGIYHGRVVLPKDYPGSPPRVHIVTPSGRFVPGADICLSASSYHPESWTPQWTIQGLIQSLRLHFLTEANEIGGMHASHSKRRALAMTSRQWRWGIPSSMAKSKRPIIIDHPMMLSSGDFGHDVDDGRKLDSVLKNNENPTPAKQINATKNIPTVSNASDGKEQTTIEQGEQVVSSSVPQAADDCEETKEGIEDNTLKGANSQSKKESTRPNVKYEQLDLETLMEQQQHQFDVYNKKLRSYLMMQEVANMRRRQILVQKAIRLLRIVLLVALLKFLLSVRS